MHSIHTMHLLTFLPDEFIPLMLVFAGLALVLQLRGIASALFTAAILMIVLPVILEPFLDMLPQWALTLLMVYFCFSMIGLVFILLIGKNAWDQTLGILAADLIKKTILFPFKICAIPFRLFRLISR